MECLFSYLGSFRKISPTCRGYSPQAQIADSSSTKAVSFSYARTMNRFPSPQCTSAIQIVRPSETMADTRPQLQPGFLRLSAMISQYFTDTACGLLIVLRHLRF